MAPTPLRTQKDKERKLRSRQALVDAAVKVFSRNGYHGTLISDIVAEAGLGQGTFYRNFKSKRDIFEQIFDDFFAEMLGQFDEMSAGPPMNLAEYRQASLRAVGRLASVLENQQDIAAMFLREATAVDHEFNEKLESLLQRFAMIAQYFLDHAIANRFARECRSDVVSQTLVGIALQMFKSWHRGYFKDINAQQLSEEIVNFAFEGFGLSN